MVFQNSGTVADMNYVINFSEFAWVPRSYLPRNGSLKYHFTYLECELPRFLVPQPACFFLRFTYLLRRSASKKIASFTDEKRVANKLFIIDLL